ncbi:hypothetical protein ACHAPO_008445 [Fusarium lateritium]
MTTWDGSVFVGNKMQIADWDLKRDDSSRNFYNRESGYLIRKPFEASGTKRRGGVFNHFRMGNHLNSSGIRDLYRGKLDFDPTGKHGRIKYTILEAGKRIKELAKTIKELSTGAPERGPSLKRLLKEVGQDICKGKLHDAFVGRLDTRLESWAVIKKEIEDGILDETDIYVAFQRWILSIPPEHT